VQNSEGETKMLKEVDFLLEKQYQLERERQTARRRVLQELARELQHQSLAAPAVAITQPAVAIAQNDVPVDSLASFMTSTTLKNNVTSTK
jgi:hypothetical protein